MKSIRRIFDPNEADLRGNPENVKDLIIAAQNGRIVALDNLSSIRAVAGRCVCVALPREAGLVAGNFTPTTKKNSFACKTR